MSAPSYARLPQVSVAPVPVYASPGRTQRADELARRFARAYAFLTAHLAISPVVRLAVLSRHDWASLTHTADYGCVFFDYPQQTVVMGTDVTTFWHPAVELLAAHVPASFERLRQIYANAAGTLDLTPHVDLWAIHDLGHACHLAQAYWFPRKWLMELFASLCVYTYIAENEADLLPIAEAFLLTMHEVPAERFAHQTLAAFEQVYTAMPLEDYLWYSGHFMQQAKALYAELGLEALETIWRSFVVANMRDVDDHELQQRLAEHPALASGLLTLPSAP